MLVIGRAHAAGGIRPGFMMEMEDERAERLIAAGIVASVEDLDARDPQLALDFLRTGAEARAMTMEAKDTWSFSATQSTGI